MGAFYDSITRKSKPRAKAMSRDFKHIGVTLEFQPRTVAEDYSVVAVKRNGTVLRSYENCYEEESLKRWSRLEETLDLLDTMKEPF